MIILKHLQKLTFYYYYF